MNKGIKHTIAGLEHNSDPKKILKSWHSLGTNPSQVLERILNKNNQFVRFK
jgi:hypothetical protein